MTLTTHEKARKALAKLIKDYESQKESDGVKFRNLVHSFSILLSFFKFEKEIELEKEIEAIKEKLGMA